MNVEWQLPVTEDVSRGAGHKIHGNAKIHCFIDGYVLCNRGYCLIPGYWETTYYREKDIDEYHEYFCKKCVEKFKTMKNKGKIT